MQDDIQELKSYLENMREQCILGQDCADLDVHDMTVLLTMIEKFERSQKEIVHWKNCTESEQKIAGNLQRKVEVLSKALVGKAELSSKVEELTKENAVLKQKLEETVAFYNSKIK